MVDWFRAWSKSIVVAVIIATVLEMILPNNNSKKYIKIVIGIFVVYTIISPILGYSLNDSIDGVLETEKYLQASSSNMVIDENFSSKSDKAIKSIYTQNLQNDIKGKLKSKGYIAENIEVNICNDGSYSIEKIAVSIVQKIEDGQTEKQVQTIVDSIEYIVVKLESKNDDNSIIDENDKKIIRQLIKENYGVGDNNISVN